MTTDLSSYRDQHFKGTRTEQEKLLKTSSTLYVGNMSFYTTEEQVIFYQKKFLLEAILNRLSPTKLISAL